MLESTLERNVLVPGVTDVGGLCWKFKSPGLNGVPDRLILLPGGLIHFIECKRPRKDAEKHQARIHDELRSRGFFVDVLSDVQDYREYIERIRIVTGQFESIEL